MKTKISNADFKILLKLRELQEMSPCKKCYDYCQSACNKDTCSKYKWFDHEWQHYYNLSSKAQYYFDNWTRERVWEYICAVYDFDRAKVKFNAMKQYVEIGEEDADEKESS